MENPDPNAKAKFDMEAAAAAGEDNRESYITKDRYEYIVSILLSNASKKGERENCYYRMKDRYQIIMVNGKPNLIKRKNIDSDPNLFVVTADELYIVLLVNGPKVYDLTIFMLCFRQST